MKQNQTKRLVLNKKTVSVLQANKMASLKGGAGDTVLGAFGGITKPQSDSFIQCGSCHSNCATNSTVCGPVSIAEL